MQNAFNVFDLDNSGQLDRKEMRLILNTMYPKMRGKHQLAAMKAVGSDEVSFEDFHEAVTPRPKRRPSVCRNNECAKKKVGGAIDVSATTLKGWSFCA